jgi:thioesterase domain-containing protein
MADLERIVPLSPDGTAAPLYCVHASSGSAYTYLGLAELLGPDQPVYGIEAPGFDGSRAPVPSLPALSAEYAETLLELQPDGDFSLLGWSMGGVIAFATAQQLSALGAQVRCLILVDVSVPHRAELPPEDQLVCRFLHEMLASVGAPADEVDRTLSELSDHADSESLFLAVERAGVLPAELDAELLIDRYPVFRANVEASYGYQVTLPYPGPVVHLVATDSASPGMYWGTVATDLTEQLVPGDHHSIWRGEGVQRLAELVTATLAGNRPAGTSA